MQLQDALKTSDYDTATIEYNGLSTTVDGSALDGNYHVSTGVDGMGASEQQEVRGIDAVIALIREKDLDSSCWVPIGEGGEPQNTLEWAVATGLFNMAYLETDKRIIIQEIYNTTAPYRRVTVNDGLAFNASTLVEETFHIYPNLLERDPEFMVDTELEKEKFHQLLVQYAGPDYRTLAWKPWTA